MLINIFYKNEHLNLPIKILSTIVSLLPIFLISGPLLSDLTIVISSLIFLYFSIKNRELKYFKNYYFYYFIIFYFYLLINGAFINQNQDTLKISITYLRFIIFPLTIWYLIEKDKNFLKKFYICLLLGLLALILDGFYQFIFDENLFGKKIISSRVSSFFGDELILGSYISRIFPIYFALTILLYGQNKKILYLSCIIFILSEVLTLVSGDRSALFYINLSAIFLIIYLNKFKKIRIITFLMSSIIIFFSLFFSDQVKNRIVVKTMDDFLIKEKTSMVKEKKKTHNEQKIYIFSRQHHEHYISSLKMFNDNLIFGVGIKNFRNFCSKKEYYISELTCSTHSHNTYIQLLAETGLIGFLFIAIIFICFVAVFIIKIFSNKSFTFDDFQISLFSGILISLWPFLPTGNFFNNWLCILYFLPIGFILWSLNNKKKIN